MLRAALIGFGSTGKTTLFQLMTSARGDSARPAPGRAEASIGISKVPDVRLDRLTAMYNPKKAGARNGRILRSGRPRRQPAGARTLVDVAAYKNADALVHVLRAFDDPAVPHPAGSIEPARDAQSMEDELILADLGVAERRLERIERDLKKNRSGELERERDGVALCRAALEEGRPLQGARPQGRRPEAAARLPVSLRQASPDRHQPRRESADRRRSGSGAASTGAAERAGLGPFPRAGRYGRRRRVRENRARDRPARRHRRGRRFWPTSA